MSDWEQQYATLKNPMLGDLCFLRGVGHNLRSIIAKPDAPRWWIEQQKKIGDTFTKRGRPSYEQLATLAATLATSPLAGNFEDEFELTECNCTD